MSDEDVNMDIIPDEEESVTSSDDTPLTPGAYCTDTDVASLFGDISDGASQDLMVTAINNGTAWINSNLTRRYVPIPVVDPTIILTEEVDEITTGTTININEEHGLNITRDSDITVLKTAAIYYSASDILLSLYHGDELPVQYDVWFQKAQTFLEAYIDAYLNSEADEQDLLAHQVVGHSKSRTYREKRMDRGYW